jgi:hypothetical protein
MDLVVADQASAGGASAVTGSPSPARRPGSKLGTTQAR